jgi:ribosomal protein S18 acetylase RimI-like enzyme
MSKPKTNCKIRAIKPADYHILADFLYLSIFQPPGAEPLLRDIIEKPEIAVYIDGFGSVKSDCGVVVEQDGNIVGAAWARKIHGYGHIDDDTPELAISVLPEYRNQGIGGKMLKNLFELLVEKGVKQTSLSVQKANPAWHLYQRLGYKTESESDDDYIMLHELKQELQARGIGLGMCFGVAFGAVIGSITGEIGTWIPIGLCIGMAVGCGWFEISKRRKK